MYTHCDVDGNEYLLLDFLIDYQFNENMISLVDQMMSMQGRPVIQKSTVGEQICCLWKDDFT